MRPRDRSEGAPVLPRPPDNTVLLSLHALHAACMKSLSFRIPQALAERVAERTRRWQKSDSEVYRQIIDDPRRLRRAPPDRL